jgi:hypothetical protein
VLNGMVRHIIEQANWSHVDLDAGSPENVRANKRGFRAHVRLVELVAAQEADEAEALWRLHLAEAENYLLMNKSMTTVLDLLGLTRAGPPSGPARPGPLRAGPPGRPGRQGGRRSPI